MAKNRKDPHKLNAKEARIAVAKLLEATQNANYHGDIRLKMRDGELFHIDLSQSALPRDILEERFVCVLLRSNLDGVQEEGQEEDSS